MRVEYACHAAYACICIHMHKYTHLHAHIYICMHCVCIKAYACMACMHLHMHAWHACIVACLIPCAPPPHIPQGGEGGMTMCEALTRWIPHDPPHIPQGGGHHQVNPYPLAGRGGGATGPRDMYIHIHVHISHSFSLFFLQSDSTHHE